MSYVYQKFPLSLYLRGDVSADHVIVTSEDEEAAKRAEGFRGAWEPQEKAIEAVITARNVARKQGDNEMAGEIAQSLSEQGVTLTDTPHGTAWEAPAKRRPGRPRKAD